MTRTVRLSTTGTLASLADWPRTPSGASAAAAEANSRLRRRTFTVVSLFPFDCSGRLGRDVVGDAVDAAHLVDDAVRDPGEELVRQRRPVGGHEIGGLDRAQ